ncbi:Stage III sporulation protein AE precursor [compost metagenome]
MSVLSSLELDKDSSIKKIAYFICFLTIATILVKTFSDTLIMFRSTIGIVTTLMQIVSPFLMTVLIATGAITSTGIIQPMLLFLASLVSFIINYVVIPLISISVAFNIVNSLTDKIKLTRISKLFSKTAMWTIGVSLTVFLGILSLESSITASVDSLAIKTTQTAVSNFVPVVGKFFSDSFETVVGATKIVSRVGGAVGIIAIVLVTVIPIIKIFSIMVVYNILSALAEPICSETKITKALDMFADTYKTLLGILIGVTILFVISTGIILNLSTSIIK